MYSERRDYIVKYIHDNGQATLKELLELYPDISDMTLRRDLAFLEKQGYIIRTRGGAVSRQHLGSEAEDRYSQRSLFNIPQKRIIAEKAVKLLEPNRSIYLDSGSTVMMMVKAMTDENYYIVSAGVNIALECLRNQKPSITLVGGNVSHNTISASGINALQFISNINIDIAFMACSGFSFDTGFTSGSYAECELKRTVLTKARKRVMLSDSSKINKRMPFTFAQLEDIDIWVSDGEIPAEVAAQVTAKGVTIL